MDMYHMQASIERWENGPLGTTHSPSRLLYFEEFIALTFSHLLGEFQTYYTTDDVVVVMVAAVVSMLIVVLERGGGTTLK